MKKSTDMGNIQDRPGEEPVALAYPTLDRLALAWSIGIGIGYVFLISFICWIGYRCFLIYGAYRAGDNSFIVAELKTDVLISAAYFGIAGILRKAGYI
ncbi:hypothetical protein [Methanoregula sp.]|uniref:hypothetical protein n=1 Tax=Methanoregula sp. TaxID=2052170 RepID=UPI003BB1C335